MPSPQGHVPIAHPTSLSLLLDALRAQVAVNTRNCLLTANNVHVKPIEDGVPQLTLHSDPRTFHNGEDPSVTTSSTNSNDNNPPDASADLIMIMHEYAVQAALRDTPVLARACLLDVP